MSALRKFLLLSLLPLVGTLSQVSSGEALRPKTMGAGHVMARAGYIFTGTVMRVKRIDSPNAVAKVEVAFRVDRGIRGVKSGQLLTIHEWAGLWADRERYRVGQSVVLFLYRTSKLGLTSPVGNSLGQLNIDKDGRVTLPPGWTAENPGGRASEPGARWKSRMNVRDFTREVERRAE